MADDVVDITQWMKGHGLKVEIVDEPSKAKCSDCGDDLWVLVDPSPDATDRRVKRCTNPVHHPAPVIEHRSDGDRGFE